jgi:hypothetical protein
MDQVQYQQVSDPLHGTRTTAVHRHAQTEILTNVANKADTIGLTVPVEVMANKTVKTAEVGNPDPQAADWVVHVRQEPEADLADLVRRELEADLADLVRREPEVDLVDLVPEDPADPEDHLSVEQRQMQLHWAKKCRADATKKKNMKFVAAACKKKMKTEKHAPKEPETPKAMSFSMKNSI